MTCSDASVPRVPCTSTHAPTGNGSRSFEDKRVTDARPYGKRVKVIRGQTGHGRTPLRETGQGHSRTNGSRTHAHTGNGSRSFEDKRVKDARLYGKRVMVIRGQTGRGRTPIRETGQGHLIIFKNVTILLFHNTTPLNFF